MTPQTPDLKFKILAAAAEICAGGGVRQFIISPGSRSAPLTIVLARHPGLHCRAVMDERAAGFIALGLAQQTGQPAGLVCTSGTAALNYAPAVAEAYYQQIPLLVFTADRPPEWIDQQDGQTLHQRNLYNPHCRGSFELPSDAAHPDAQWHAGRIISEAINRARWPIPGPVHVNVPLREPLYPAPGETIAPPAVAPIIRPTPAEPALPGAAWAGLLSVWQSAPKKLIVAGMHPPDAPLVAALTELGNDPTVAVIAGITANLQPGGHTLSQADMVLGTRSAARQNQLRPRLVISFGGPVVSKNLKLFLRNHPPADHWHISPTGEPVDTFKALTRTIAARPASFFAELAARRKPAPSGEYRSLWRRLNAQARQTLADFLEQAPFGEFAAVYRVMQALPPHGRLQLGNSMPVRYATIAGLTDPTIRVSANRGVSGIDGTLSTAVGAALASTQLTTLITGDLAFFYDRNALWHNHLPPNLRVVVLNNGGGGIFKLIDGPAGLPPDELAQFFFTPHPLTARRTAADHNCHYLSCRTARQLKQHLPRFFAPHQKPVILEVKTDSERNADIFRQFKSKMAALGNG